MFDFEALDDLETTYSQERPHEIHELLLTEDDAQTPNHQDNLHRSFSETGEGNLHETFELSTAEDDASSLSNKVDGKRTPQSETGQSGLHETQELPPAENVVKKPNLKEQAQAYEPVASALTTPAKLSPSNMWKVSFVTLGTGTVAEMELHQDVTAVEVKDMLQMQLDIPKAEQRLLAGVAVWEDPLSLGSACKGIQVDQTVQITVVRVPLAVSVALSGNRTGKLRVWDLENGNLLREWAGHEGAVNCVAMCWAAQCALSGGEDGILRKWDLTQWNVLREMTGHQAAVNCLAAAWANSFVVSGSSDKSLRLWDLDRGKCRLQFDQHSGPVTCVAVNEVAWKAASGSEDRSVLIWDLHTGKIVQECRGHVSPVHCVSLDDDMTYSASGGWGTLKLWSVANKQKGALYWSGHQSMRLGISGAGFNVDDLKGHMGPINAVSIDWHTHRGVTGSDDATLCFWSADERRASGFRIRPTVLRKHTLPVTCLSVDWSTARAISGAGDCLWLWDLNECRALRALRGPEELGEVLCVDMDRA